MIRLAIVFMVVLTLLAFGSCPAISAIVGTTDDPMIIGGGARPLGMGRANTAIADDADGAFINPAGIAAIKAPQAMTMYTNLLGDVYYTEYCGVIPGSFGVVGAGFVNTGVSQVLTFVGSTGVFADYHDTLFVLTYSTPLARFFGYSRNVFFGINLKYFSRGWTGGATQTSTGWSSDFGIKYIYNPYLSFGYNRQNFLPVDLGGVVRYSSGAEEAIASVHKVGIAVKPMRFGNKLLIAYDADLPVQSGRPVTMHIGAEYKMNEFFMLRAGMDQSVDASSGTQTNWNPSAGVSLGTAGFRVDYAYHAYYNDPGLATSYVSFSINGKPTLALEGEVR
ncbi:hypothetical protein A3J44_05110 [candidate division WOR-1 bacterium RIFCSPHIGHO2_02_FULL_45_12]|nr:MAG: hypothetical protein A3J44_05110 [candidate division WOR-1 bacterium RIFCSPHIGHO2_02_FULL_45_12]